jgi:hypothetical protein
MWQGVAACYLNDKFIGGPPVPDGAEQSKRLRVAARNGEAHFISLDISPRPAGR